MSTLALPSRPVHPEDGGRGLLLALAAHGVLVWALAYGVNWRSSSESAIAEAELWAVVPQAAAPKAEEAPPPEPVRPPPQVQREEAQPPKAEREAEIAQERERRRKEELRKQAEEEEQKQRKAREQKRAKELEKLEDLRKQQEADKKAEREAREAKAEEAKREKQRQENLRRIQGLAGGTGAPGATGTAAKSAGPSAGYAGRIMARIKPNITYTDTLTQNYRTEVLVRCAPDGLIIGRRITKSSGNPAWDDAVLKAIDKTERLPRDTNGTVPSEIPMGFNSLD